MIFEITQEHIDKGARRDCNDCPLALAIVAKFPDAWVSVGYHEVQISYHKLRLPLEVRTFVAAFDSNPKAARPMTFELPDDQLPKEEEMKTLRKFMEAHPLPGKPKNHTKK